MRSTFRENDVTLLLKDISGLVTPLSAAEREQRIQSGVHYSEMLPLEYRPTEKYKKAYHNALRLYSQTTANAIALLSENIFAEKGSKLTLVSFARAGTPIGILIKRYLDRKYAISVPHYSISIIRGKGIDKNAIDYILERHCADSIQFVDGWIGKGAILRELEQALAPFPCLHPSLAVVSDPANMTQLCGTHEDFLIPSSCLNSTITGLISRTFQRDDIIGPHDFHGAAYLEEFEEEDVTNQYLNLIEQLFPSGITPKALSVGLPGLDVVYHIAKTYNIDDINLIKPGIGETTRVLLRRIPWRVIINPDYFDSEEIYHIKLLANDRGVDVEKSPVELGNYKACGIIRKLTDI